MKAALISVLTLALFSNINLLEAKVSNEIITAVDSQDRPESEKVRDKNRKPAEILQLLGVKPGMRVVDLSAATGYYTDLLSRVVGDEGEVIAHNAPYVINRFPQFLNNPKQGWLPRLNSKQWKKNVTKMVSELDSMPLPVQVDAAIMVLFYHDTVWQNVNRKMMNQHIFNSLKRGGSFLIIDHSGKKGSELKDVNTLHRIDKQTVIDEVTAAGFQLDTDSDLLSNSKDNRDYIFTRDIKNNRDQTDRMVLKFVKP